MQLNANYRAAFVRGVMGELPPASSDELRTEAQKLILEEAEKSLPAEVLALWEDPQLKKFVATSWRYGAHFSTKLSQEIREARSKGFTFDCSVAVPLPEENHPKEHLAFMSKGARAKLDKVIETAFQRFKDRNVVEEKLKRTIAGFSTVKQALAGLPPELHKYLPQPPSKTAGVPALASVLPDLKRLGWPAPPVAQATKPQAA